MVLHILVLSVGSFAVGTGTFVVAGVLTDIAEDLSVSTANAGLLVTVFAVTFAVGSPSLSQQQVALGGDVCWPELWCFLLSPT